MTIVFQEAKRIAISKGENVFFNGKPCVYGHVGARYVCNNGCRECLKIRGKMPDTLAKKREDAKRWAAENPEARKANVIAWRKANPEKVAAIMRRHHQLYPERHSAIQQARRAAKRNAMPAWVDRKGVADFYRNRPKGLTVDHIIPLISDLVCGLHVLPNLQYLPPGENFAKGNKFIP